MTNRQKFTEVFDCEIVRRDTGEPVPGHCKILIAQSEHFDEWLQKEYEPSEQPGWIPCDRELPKPNEEDGNGFYKAYLVQDGRWMDVARWDGKYWVAWGYSTVLLNVVAWCELPTPYREGGHDGKG